MAEIAENLKKSSILSNSSSGSNSNQIDWVPIEEYLVDDYRLAPSFFTIQTQNEAN